MYVTLHAANRIDDRLGFDRADDILDSLERVPGVPGTIAFVFEAQQFMVADDGSNGDTIVAIAVDGSVETVYFRRSTQDMSAEFFGADKVVKL
jgi:hypothetical protein